MQQRQQKSKFVKSTELTPCCCPKNMNSSIRCKPGRPYYVSHSVESLEERRLLSSGNLDSSFGAGGTAGAPLIGGADAVALERDGKILVANGLDVSRLTASGSLDHTFAIDGVARAGVSEQVGELGAIALQRDGKIVVVGTLSAGAVEVVRYLPAGSLDPSFGKGGTMTIAMDQAHSLAIQPGGAILVGGSKSIVTGSSAHPQFALDRLTASGAADESFGDAGQVLTDFPVARGVDPSQGYSQVDAILLGADGRITVAGQHNDGISDRFALARYFPSGRADTSFGKNGSEVVSQFTLEDSNLPTIGASLAPAGQILLAGPALITSTVPGYPQVEAMEVVRLSSSGAVDKSFGTAGRTQLPLEQGLTPFRGPDIYEGDGSFTVLQQRTGKIVVVASNITVAAGSIGPITYSDSFILARFSSSGILDRVFGTSGIEQTFQAAGATAADAVLEPDGGIIVAGSSPNETEGPEGFLVDSPPDLTVARYTDNGHLGLFFGYYGTVRNINGVSGSIAAVAEQKDGKILVAGNELSPATWMPTDAVVARYNSDGSLDTTFGYNGRSFLNVGSSADFNALAIESNGDIVAGGYGQSGLTDVFAIERLLPDGRRDTAFGAGGEVLSTFGDPSGQRCNALALQSNGDIVAAGTTFDSSGNPMQMAVARYLPSGALDPFFGTAGEAVLRHTGEVAGANGVAIQGDGRIVLAGSSGGNFAVVRLTSAGQLDSGFGARGAVVTPFRDVFGTTFSQAQAILIDKSGAIVVAGFTLPSASPFFGDGEILVRYLPSGKRDYSFGTGTAAQQSIFELRAIALQPDGKIVGGGLSPRDAVVARFGSRGSLDASFGADGVTNLTNIDPESTDSAPPVLALALQTDGKIIAAFGSELVRILAK